MNRTSDPPIFSATACTRACSWDPLSEAFRIETGYGDGQSRHHTVLRPEGKEPPTAGGGFAHSWEGGHTQACITTKDADYVCVDSAWQWHSLWNVGLDGLRGEATGVVVRRRPDGSVAWWAGCQMGRLEVNGTLICQIGRAHV